VSVLAVEEGFGGALSGHGRTELMGISAEVVTTS
jgi:hypothetical protein